jgi:hypothetical protein
VPSTAKVLRVLREQRRAGADAEIWQEKRHSHDAYPELGATKRAVNYSNASAHAFTIDARNR